MPGFGFDSRVMGGEGRWRSKELINVLHVEARGVFFLCEIYEGKWGLGDGLLVGHTRLARDQVLERCIQRMQLADLRPRSTARRGSRSSTTGLSPILAM